MKPKIEWKKKTTFFVFYSAKFWLDDLIPKIPKINIMYLPFTTRSLEHTTQVHISSF